MSDVRIARRFFDLHCPPDRKIRGELCHRGEIAGKPIVVICHSFMAFKDWGFFPHTAAMFARAGFVAVCFNFSRNGVIGDEKRITDFRAFETNTFSIELNDLTIILNAIEDGSIDPETVNRSSTILLGHSRGGGIAIVHASSDTRIRALVTWSAICSFDRWTDHQKRVWRTSGNLPLAKDATTSPLRLGLELLDDLERHAKRLNILRAAQSLAIPWLIIHGNADVTVPYHEAEQLYASSNHRTTTLKRIDHAGHLYHASTFEEDQYKTLNSIIDQTLGWLGDHLS